MDFKQQLCVKQRLGDFLNALSKRLYPSYMLTFSFMWESKKPWKDVYALKVIVKSRSRVLRKKEQRDILQSLTNELSNLKNYDGSDPVLKAVQGATYKNNFTESDDEITVFLTANT